MHVILTLIFLGLFVMLAMFLAQLALTVVMIVLGGMWAGITTLYDKVRRNHV